ncbi:MAG: hypothetical protein ACN4GZ_12635 [Acidimicrobiales bacterium]
MEKQTDQFFRGHLSALVYILIASLTVVVPLALEARGADVIDALAPPEPMALITSTTARTTSTVSAQPETTSTTRPPSSARAVSSAITVAPTVAETTPSTSAVQPVAAPSTRPPTTAPPTTSAPTTKPPTTKPPTTKPPTTKPPTTKPPTTKPTTTVPADCSSGPWKTLARARRGFAKQCKGYTRVDCAELKPKQWTCSSKELERPTTTTTEPTTTAPTTTTTTEPTTTTTTTTTEPTTTTTAPTTTEPTTTTVPEPVAMGLAVLNAANGAGFDGGEIETFTVEAFAPVGTRSVRFSVSGPINSSKIEGSARWTLFGNNGNNLGGRPALPGTYTAVAKAYSGKNGTGSLLATGSVTFTFG